MNKKGVSLIVMVITVLVLMLIAGAVILNLVEHNPIEESKKTKIQVDMKNYTLDLDSYIKSKMQEDPNFDETTVNAISAVDIKKIIPNFKSDYEKFVVILEGKLKIKESAIKLYTKEVAWLNEVGIKSENEYKIPDGFIYVEGEEDTGIVIRDKVNGNEFVWVPVNNPLEFKRENSLVRKGISTQLVNAILKEEEENSKGFQEFKSSVIKNGGFYIGRYETSLASNGNFRSVLNGDSKQALIQNSNIDNAMLKANLLYENNNDVKCNMLYGTAYDYTINWIAKTNSLPTSVIQNDSKGKGQYLSSAILTGSNLNYKLNNIYDLAGNCYEITLEASENSSVFRGGSAEEPSTMSIMSRNATSQLKGNPRLILYFK